MKKLYIIFNIFLVLGIITSLTLNPKHKNITTKQVDRIIRTSDLRQVTFRKSEETIDVKDEKEEKEEENKITESINNVEQNISQNVVEAAVVTDVLERQVGPMSAYGPDCAGCSGHLATGFDARQSVTYQDPTYGTVRIVAGDRKYPFGTIVRISGTRLGTFNAIVMDRGGAIGIGKRFMFDLLCRTEAEASGVGSFQNVTFEILRYGY